MSRRKCGICGTRTEHGEECTVTTPRKSKCRPELVVPIDKEAWVCDACIYAYQVIGSLGERYLESHDIEMEP